jgi:hypothetical protein
MAEGCSVLRKSRTVEEANNGNYTADLVGMTVENNISGKNFDISKATLVISQNGETQKLLIGVRHKVPDTTLLIIRSRMGVEAARIFLTNDTVLINDRLNKKLIVGKPEEIKARYGFDTGMLYMVLGDLLKDKNRETEAVKCNNGTIKKEFSVGQREVEYNIDCNRKKVMDTEIREDIRNGGISIKFEKFMKLNGITIPQKIELIDEDLASDIKISIEKVMVDWAGEIDFIPGKGYVVNKLR